MLQWFIKFPEFPINLGKTPLSRVIPNESPELLYLPSTHV